MNIHNLTGNTVASLNASIGLDDAGLKRGLAQAKQAITECGQQLERLKGPLDQLASGMGGAAAAARGAAAGTKEQETALKSLGAAATGTADRLRATSASLQALGQSATRAGRNLTLGLTLPLVALAKEAIGVEASYETSMNQLQAATGASAAQMAVLGQKATDLGADLTLPGTSAADAGRAMLALSRAGLNVRDVFDASLPTMRLSAATHVENAKAAQILAVTLNEFGLAGKDAAGVADVLTAAGNRTAGGPNVLFEGLRKAGPVLHELKVPVNDAVIALALLNRAGVSGGEAGTALRGVFSRLIDPAKKAAAILAEQGINLFDASGKMKSMADIAQILHDRLGKLTDQQRLQVEHTLGQQRGMTVLSVLAKEGAAGFEAMAKKIGLAGEAARQAEAQMKGIPGALEAMRSGFETAAQAAIGPLSQDLTALGKRLAELLVSFSQLPAPTRKLWVEIAAGAAIFGPLLMGIGQAVLLFTRLKVALGEARIAQAAMTVTMGETEALVAAPLLLNPITLALGALAAAVLAVTTNWHGMGDAFRQGLGTLERLPGNIAAGYGAMGALRRSAEESLAANAPQENVWGDVGMVPAAAATNVLGPSGARPAAGGKQQRDAALAAAMAGGAGKLSPLQQEQKSFTEALAQAHSRLSEVMLGEDQITERVAGKYHLLSAAQRAQLVTVLQQIQKGEELRRMHDAIEKNTRIRTALAHGESPAVARLSAEYEHLSRGQRQAIASSQEMTEKALQAAESQKTYTKDLEKLNAEIRRLKAGHDAEAGGLDALKEKYPGLTRAQLQHVFATQQYELSLQKVHDIQQRVNAAIRESGLRFMEQTAATRAGQAALSLFRDQAEAFEKLHPGATAQQFWASLAPNQQRRAKDTAFEGAAGALTQQLNQVTEENAALRTGQRSQYLARTMFGQDLGQIKDPGIVRQINQMGTQQDLREQRGAGFEAFNAPLHQANQLIGTINPQLQRLGEQFQALSGKSTLARDVMEKFGVVLKDLPKATQQSLRSFFELSRGLQFFQQFAQGVQGVFQNMFTHLAEHGFKGFFRSVVTGFSQMLQQMAAQYLSSQLASVFMNLVGGVIGGAFGGGGASGADWSHVFGMASGGPVAAGMPYLVGERGPELFMPRQSGGIVPHAQLAGAGGHTINLYVSGVSDVQSFRAPHNQAAIMADLQRGLDRARRRG